MDGRNATLKGVTSQRKIHSGVLQKRCRLSWRPRQVELVSDPTDLSGMANSFHLHIFDQHKRMLKDRICINDVVTIRASRDCFFQLFLTSGKIVQFRTTTMESQAHWMAMFKMALGKGCIFHVRLSTTNTLDHAMLYSISVNLPAHRADQLDRVLVAASPINDINLYAWDLNRVKRFIELDIGVRMELCHSCYRGRSMNITFILEKQFVKDCIDFLCKEAQIIGPPSVVNGLFIYNVDHKCAYCNVSPSSLSDQEDEAPPIPPRPPKPASCNGESSILMEKDNSELHVRISSSISDAPSSENPRQSLCFTTTSVDLMLNKESPGTAQYKPFKPAIPIPEYWDDYTGSDSCTAGTGMEYFYLTDGTYSTKNKPPPPPPPTSNSGGDNSESFLPPRTIPRKNHESSIPALENPYYNFQPHLFNDHGNQCFDAPYQISSKIIIKDSGEVQFERNIMGNRPPKRHGGFHFKQDIPIPPRGIRASMVDVKGTTAPTGGAATCTGNTPPLVRPTGFNFQSNTEAQFSETGSQFFHTVNTSMSPIVDPEAPPIPPRPQRKSSGNSNLSTCSWTTSPRPNRTSCKSPVPLPRTNTISSSNKAPSTQVVDHTQSLSDDQKLLQDFTTDSVVAKPRTEPFILHSEPPHRGMSLGKYARTNSDSELESYSHKNGEKSADKLKFNSLERSIESSYTSDHYFSTTPPPLPQSMIYRSDSKNSLSPSYVDETQFILQTSSPYYLKLLEVDEKQTNDEKARLSSTITQPSFPTVDSAIGSDWDGHSFNPMGGASCSSSPPDNEDFEDASSIAFIQSTFYQRCTSSASQCSLGTGTGSGNLLEDYTRHLSLEDSEQKPEVPPRPRSVTSHRNYKDEEDSKVSISTTANQPEEEKHDTSTSLMDRPLNGSLSDSQLLGAYTRHLSQDDSEQKPEVPPRPRSVTSHRNYKDEEDSKVSISITANQPEEEKQVLCKDVGTTLTVRPLNGSLSDPQLPGAYTRHLSLDDSEQKPEVPPRPRSVTSHRNYKDEEDSKVSISITANQPEEEKQVLCKDVGTTLTVNGSLSVPQFPESYTRHLSLDDSEQKPEIPPRQRSIIGQRKCKDEDDSKVSISITANQPEEEKQLHCKDIGTTSMFRPLNGSLSNSQLLGAYTRHLSQDDSEQKPEVPPRPKSMINQRQYRDEKDSKSSISITANQPEEEKQVLRKDIGTTLMVCPHNGSLSDSQLLGAYARHLSLDDSEQKPEVPPRQRSIISQRKYRDEEDSKVSISITTNQPEEEKQVLCKDVRTTLTVRRPLNGSLSDSQLPIVGVPAQDQRQTATLKPIPRPRTKSKLNLSKSLTALSSSDSNLLDSVNNAEKTWRLKSEQKSSSLCTRFFLDEMGIGVSEL